MITHHVEAIGHGSTQTKAMLAFLTEFTRLYEVTLTDCECTEFAWRQFPRPVCLKPGEWITHGRMAMFAPDSDGSI